VSAERDEPGEWSDQAEEIAVRPNMSEVVSFRISSRELDALEQAAGQSAVSLSQYIREAIALRLHGMPIGPAVEITSGAGNLMVRSHLVTGARKENPSSPVPD